jgi:hypothetical protein
VTEARALCLRWHCIYAISRNSHAKDTYFLVCMQLRVDFQPFLGSDCVFVTYIYARQKVPSGVYHFRDFTLKLSKKNEMDETDSSTPEQCSVQFVTAMVCATSKTLESPSQLTQKIQNPFAFECWLHCSHLIIDTGRRGRVEGLASCRAAAAVASHSPQAAFRS